MTEETAFLDGHVPESKNPVGRPVNENQAALVDKFIDLVAEGSQIIPACEACKVPKSTMFRWIDANPEYGRRYSFALAWRSALRGDECITIADDDSGDFVEGAVGENDLPHVIENKKSIARAALQINTRLKIMGHEHPKVYGAQPKQIASAEPERRPEDAKLVQESRPLLELHPMTEQLEAWKNAAGGTV